MKHLLFFLIMIGVGKLVAQPVLQESDVFQVGSQVTYGYLLNPAITVGNSGGNQQFDFQNLTPDYNVQRNIVLPPNSPFGGAIPGNRVVLYNNGTGGADYYTKFNGVFRLNGSVSTSTSNPNYVLKDLYSPFMKMGMFPLAYQQSDSGVFKQDFTFFVGQDLGEGWVTDSIRRRTSTRYVYHFDAWGNLVTTGNTFPVLRQKTTYVVVDSIDFLRASNQTWYKGIQVLRTNKTIYTFWGTGQSFPVAQALDLENDGVIEDCIWNTASVTTGIKEQALNEPWGVYPNPAIQEVKIEGEAVSKANWKLLDLQGRVIKSGTCDSSEETIPLNDVQPGIFFLSLDKGGKTSTKKIVKR